MEWGQQLKKHQQNSRDAMYQNPNYNFERNERKSLVIKMDSDTVSDSAILIEPLIIDKLSDVYLESFTTYHAITADSADEMGFILGIDKFNIKTSSNDNLISSKIFIPNEQTENGDPSKGRVHKGKKLNYICSINPCKLSQLTYTLTLLDGTTPIAADSDFVAYAEFVIVARD